MKRLLVGWFSTVVLLFALAALVPKFHSDGTYENRSRERNALGALRGLIAAEKEIKTKRLWDRDNNSVGEFATFEQMRLEGLWEGCPPLDGSKTNRGYRFELHVSMKIKCAEERWYCVAWPEESGRTTSVTMMQTFLVDQTCQLYIVTGGNYSGSKGPSVGDLFDGGDETEGVLSARCVPLRE